MKERADLIAKLADVVVDADDPRRLAEGTLEVLMSLSNGRSSAVFSLNGERLTLFASRNVDQSVLDAIQTIWEHNRSSLVQGEAFYVADRSTDQRIKGSAAASGGSRSFVVVPVFGDEVLCALLYVDSLDPHFCTEHDLARILKLARILAKATTDDSEPAQADGWEAYLERTPPANIERDKLLLLLNRNEWNISRVARLMGVTRRTIYLRLARYKIPREHVRKTVGRTAPARSAPGSTS